jgi:hypothetical protein
MKKVLIGIVSLVVVALAVTLIVNASNESKVEKTDKTECVEKSAKCSSDQASCHDDKTACNPAKCGDDCCDKEKGHDHAQANCATKCQSAKVDEKHDHAKCSHHK